MHVGPASLRGLLIVISYSQNRLVSQLVNYVFHPNLMHTHTYLMCENVRYMLIARPSNQPDCQMDVRRQSHGLRVVGMKEEVKRSNGPSTRIQGP